MSSLASLALQRAVFGRLADDAALAAKISGVFDHVPKDARPPYVRLGPASAVDWSSKSFSGQRHRLTLQIFSAANADRELKEIADDVHGLLDRAPLVLEGHRLVKLGFDSLLVLRDPDGIRQAQMQFSALTHPI